jgi:hypothetical protein
MLERIAARAATFINEEVKQIPRSSAHGETVIKNRILATDASDTLVITPSAGAFLMLWLLNAGEWFDGAYEVVTSGCENCPNWAEGASSVADIIQALAVVAGLIAAWIWFRQQRKPNPRLYLEHHLTVLPITDQEILIRLDVQITNNSLVLLTITEGKTVLYLVAPNKSDTHKRRLERYRKLTYEDKTQYINLRRKDDQHSKVDESSEPPQDVKQKQQEDIPQAKPSELYREDGRLVKWPPIDKKVVRFNPSGQYGRIEVEPGETEHIYYDFIILSSFRVFELYTRIVDTRRKTANGGWILRTLHNTRQLMEMNHHGKQPE